MPQLARPSTRPEARRPRPRARRAIIGPTRSRGGGMSGLMAVARRDGPRARRALALGLICAVAAGCGGSNNTPSAGQRDHGKQLFVENCAGCHMLSAAGARGTKGPNLDYRKVSRDDALFAIRNGGFGGNRMPAN